MANQKPDKTKTRMHPRRLMLFSGIGLGAVVIVTLLGYVLYYSSRVLPRVNAAGVMISGQSLSSAADTLQAASEHIADRSIMLKSEDKSTEIHAADIGLVIDAKTTASLAYQLGRQNDFWASAADLARAPLTATNIPFTLTYDQTKLAKAVSDFAVVADTPEVNAGVKIEDGKVIETQGIAGKRINQDEATSRVIDQWRYGKTGEIVLTRRTVQPQIASGDTKTVADQARALRIVKIQLTTDKDPVPVKQSILDTWITSEIVEGKLRVALSREAVKAWLDKIAPGINTDAEEAKLTMTDGKVTVFRAGKEGKQLDTDKTADAMVAAVRQYVQDAKTDKQISVAATMIVSKPAVNDQNISSLGISELIGTATTNFVGSPENRKHNISVGAGALNGILVHPGDEFSTLKYLGKIDGAAGYLPELVIKVDKTEPEFGGGLCQVSTTLFRATMNSGLKITERRNHRYRVGYYEPPVGMDATIYEGSPDFKFVNDTASNILIQSHIEGTKITFDFYGTKDGRHSSMTDPVVSDVTPPPNPEYIQTDTLPEGTTKQTEKAHNGANASFTYTVLNGDGSVRNKQTFNSHYVPWQARYLVGTKKADAPPAP